MQHTCSSWQSRLKLISLKEEATFVSARNSYARGNRPWESFLSSSVSYFVGVYYMLPTAGGGIHAGTHHKLGLSFPAWRLCEWSRDH